MQDKSCFGAARYRNYGSFFTNSIPASRQAEEKDWPDDAGHAFWQARRAWHDGWQRNVRKVPFCIAGIVFGMLCVFDSFLLIDE
ncbi:MAG: hypothetical protein CMJ72_04805 [Planctomycetaceae bacterium]|nr:hypothetical protein [Planctomycetaceae bacterium]HCK42178.1 hypothetical protein [Planctomycetaceae bacterium]